MLTALVITVRPTRETLAPAFLGRAGQAWFLNLVHDQDPAQAESLHEGEGPRPYTVSGLVGAGPITPEGQALSPERPAWLRVTTLTADLSELLMEHIAPALPGSTLSLGDVSLCVEGVATAPGDHPWAGQASPQELLGEHSLSTKAPRRVTMRFASPTTFRSQGENIPFPLPGLVFGSLIGKWNALSPVTLHPDARRFAEANIVVSKYTLRTRYVSFAASERGAAVGCVGTCRYVIRSSDRYWGGVIRTLAAYAFYAGIGARTTMGMGQASLWDERARQPLAHELHSAG